MRLFVAINLADREKQRVQHAVTGLRSNRFPFRWVAPESVHLTLQFLGEVAEDRAARVEGAVADLAADHGPLDLDIGGIGAFPNLRRPRVLWLGVEPAPELLALHEGLGRALEPLGFARETRPFSPHITLARTRAGARAAEFTGLEALAADISYSAEVHVASIDLMRSHLGREGARYEVVSARPLGGACSASPASNRRTD